MELLLIRHALPVRRELDEGEIADPPLAEQGHVIDVREETLMSAWFARPQGIMVDERTNELRGGVDALKPAIAVGY